LQNKQRCKIAKHLQVSKNIKLSKVQEFMFVSKTTCNKPYTTNQKQKELKQKNKRHEIENKRNENKQREKNLLKKLGF
jgi:hypothetical protein